MAPAGAEHRRPRPSAPPRPARASCVSDISVVSPPMTPPRPMIPESSVTTRSSVESARSLPSSVVSRSPVARAADADRAGELVGVVAVDRAAELEHHVVGDVDGERDRALPAQHQPAGHPGRASGAVGSKPDTVRATKTGQPSGSSIDDRVALVVARRGLPIGRVVERHAVRQGRLAGDAAQRQRVGAVGVDLELDDLVAQVRAGRRRRRRARPASAGSTMMPSWSSPRPSSLAEQIIPARDVAVGLAGGDLEAAGQHAAGEHDDHEVARREVVRPADDALGLAGAVGVADVDGAPVDGLAVLLRLGLHRQHAADHQRAGDVVAGTLERLELEAQRGQPVRRGPRR